MVKMPRCQNQKMIESPKSNTEKGEQLTNSVPMSNWRQPSNPRLQLGLIGCHLVDIGMKLYSVYFVIKFSSASAAPRAPCAISVGLVSLRYATLGWLEIGLRLTWLDLVWLETWVGKSSSLPISTFHIGIDKWLMYRYSNKNKKKNIADWDSSW